MSESQKSRLRIFLYKLRRKIMGGAFGELKLQLEAQINEQKDACVQLSTRINEQRDAYAQLRIQLNEQRDIQTQLENQIKSQTQMKIEGDTQNTELEKKQVPAFDIHELASSDLGVELVHYMATTGEGTDACMEKGCLPVAAHFYQPIPDLKDLERRKIWDRISPLSGIEMNHETFLQTLMELSEYADECDWPDDPTDNPMDFFLGTGNSCFSYGCAAPLYCHIRKHKPERIIEVGSGFSSRVIAQAINRNISENSNYICNYTIIDPYTTIDVSLFPKGTIVLAKPVETVDLEEFSSLGENDLLFIDSSHMCKIGSDVNFEILDVLPILKKGVCVHFHDIPLPSEYPEVYARNKNFRVFWNEAYLLQAFLAFNSKFEVYLPMVYMQTYFLPQLQKSYPKCKDWFSGSFWIRSIK